jgi:hypothetical protein
MQKSDSGDAPNSSAKANREIVQVRYNFTGRAPFVAVASLVLALLVGAVGLFSGETNYGWQFDYFVAGPMIVGGLTCTLLFLRLLLGKFDAAMNWSLLIASAIRCFGAGDKWYVVVLVAAMAYASMLLAVDFLVGNSAPIVLATRRQSSDVR